SAGAYLEVALIQLIINSRSFLMLFAFSQKIDSETPVFHRFSLAFGVTDEVFGVSVASPGKLNPFYADGVMRMALPRWVLGTLVGVISGNILSDRLISASSLALYGRLLAVIIRPARGNKILSWLIAISLLSSLLFAVLPRLLTISSGVKIIVL